MFTLVVDDFDIKSHSQEHLDHLLDTLRSVYTIKTGDGFKYLSMTLDWDYRNRSVSKSMPVNLEKNLKRFNVILKRPTYTPGVISPQGTVLKPNKWSLSTIPRPSTLHKKRQFKKLLAPFCIMLELSIVPCSRK
jgi:hypothetical protein